MHYLYHCKYLAYSTLISFSCGNQIQILQNPLSITKFVISFSFFSNLLLVRILCKVKRLCDMYDILSNCLFWLVLLVKTQKLNKNSKNDKFFFTKNEAMPAITILYQQKSNIRKSEF